MKRLLMIVALLVAWAPAAHAIPHLQLYLEGATYDSDLESWVVSTGSFRLWVIGDVDKDGPIYDVKLAASMYGTAGTITVSPTTTLLLPDPSTPDPVDDLGGDESQFEDGGIYYTPAFTPIKNHEEYAAADDHYFWGIGDFTEIDSPVGDFGGEYPTEFPDLGQINVYDVTVTGWRAVHFDAFDHTVSARDDVKYWFVPPSHDATAIPEPGTLGLLGAGLLGLGLRLRRRR